MPRPTTVQPSGMSYAADQRSFVSRIQTPPADTERKAAMLKQSLNLLTDAATNTYDAIEQERFNHAQQVASQGGQLDEKLMKQSIAYQRGADLALARRNIVSDENDLTQQYEQEFDKERGTPDELNGFISKFLQERYSYLQQDPHVGSKIAPQLIEMRTKLVNRFMSERRESVRNDLQTSYATVAADELNKSGKLDVEKMHGEMLPTLGGKDTNTVLVKILADEAITRGKPELLDAVPDRWADGTPTFKKSPQFVDYLRTARQAAENQKVHLDGLAQQQEVKQRKADKQQAEDTLMGAILNKQDITAQTAGLLRQHVIDGETARTLLNFQESYSRQREGHAASFGAIASLESSIYSGQSGQADVMNAYNRGTFGYGESAQKEVSRLLSLVSSQERSQNDNLFSKPEYRTYFDELSSIYQARKDILGNPDAVSAQLEREAIRTYREKVIAGTSPLQARSEVLGSIKPSQVQPSVTRMSPKDAVAGLKSQRLTPAQFISTGITAKQLRDLDLSPEDRDLAIAALEAVRGLR